MVALKPKGITLMVFVMVIGPNIWKKFGGMTMEKMERQTQKIPWKIIIDGIQ